MSADQRPKKKSSVITTAQMQGYLADVGKLLQVAQDQHIHPFAAALAGAMFIRNAIDLMGGDPEWWKKLIDPKTEVEEMLGPIQVSNVAVSAGTKDGD